MGGFTRRRCGTNVDFQAAHDVAAGSLAAMVMGFQGGCEDGGQALQSATATLGTCKDGGANSHCKAHAYQANCLSPASFCSVSIPCGLDLLCHVRLDGDCSCN